MIQGYFAKLLRAVSKPDRVVVKIDTSVRGWLGLSRGRRPSDFDPTQLRRGTRIELEHVKNKLVAQRIAMDHLAEDARYYHKLAKIHHDSASARRPLTPFWRPSIKRAPTWEETCLEKHARQGLTQRQSFMKCLRELQAKRGANRAERTKETIHGYPVVSDFGHYIKKVARAMSKHGPPDLVDAVMQNCARHIQDAYRLGHDPETAAQWAINQCTTIMGRLRPQYKQPKDKAAARPRKLGRPPKHWLERCMKAVAREGTARPSLGGPAAICANNWYHVMGETRRKQIIAEARALEAKRRLAKKRAKASKQMTLMFSAYGAKIPKELQEAEAAALLAGWKIEVTGSSHLKWIPPDRTKPVVISPSTPSGHRERANTIARLRRSGLDIARVA